MRRFSPVLLASTALAVVAVVTLSGCGGGAQTADPTPAGGGASTSPAAPTTPPVASATPTPTTPSQPTPPALPANALFAISGTVTASNGATADLYQVVYKPTAADAADTALLNKQCNFAGSPSWQSQIPANPLYVTSTLTATLHPGSPAFKAVDSVNFDLGWGFSAYSGSYKGFEASCAAGYIQIPGTIHGVMTVPSANPAKGAYGWATSTSSYGFFGGGNDPGPDSSGTAVVSGCVVQLSAEASAASAKIAAWPTLPYKKANACDFEIS